MWDDAPFHDDARAMLRCSVISWQASFWHMLAPENGYEPRILSNRPGSARSNGGLHILSLGELPLAGYRWRWRRDCSIRPNLRM